VLGSRGAGKPVPSLTPLLAAARAHAVEDTLAASSGGCQALLVPAFGDRFRIVVDPTPPSGWCERRDAERRLLGRRRARFLIAHELGHTLFYKRSLDRAPWRAHAGGGFEEAFCDRFARALLIPDDVLRKCRTPGHLLAAQKTYDVSLEVTLRGLAEVQQVHVCLFHWRSDAREPIVQWSNVAAGRHEKWTRAVRDALARVRASLDLPLTAEGVLLPGRQQAFLIQSR
jgi:hypothetical protein